MAKNSWCRICGIEYEVCPTCAETKMYTPWRIICDTATHYQIWLIIRQYKEGIISKETARERFTSLKIKKSDYENFIPSVRQVIDEINSVEQIEVTEEVATVEGNEETIEKPKAQRKKNTSKGRSN